MNICKALTSQERKAQRLPAKQAASHAGADYRPFFRQFICSVTTVQHEVESVLIQQSGSSFELMTHLMIRVEFEYTALDRIFA